MSQCLSERYTPVSDPEEILGCGWTDQEMPVGDRCPPGLELPKHPETEGTTTPASDSGETTGTLREEEEEDEDSTTKLPTTLMLRNIPNRFQEEELCEYLDEQGWTGNYDAVFVPLDKRSNCNRGYAFINFVNRTEFEKGMQLLRGLSFPNTYSSKMTEVSIANVQGRDALRERAQAAETRRLKQVEDMGYLLHSMLADWQYGTQTMSGDWNMSYSNWEAGQQWATA
mmetsp:Transcript_30985/g.68034  ORF Transcript_30985/g.68034 Transcript_30985/m.68034 type:complete len:227 (+) Transcript_30985:78-758(+)